MRVLHLVECLGHARGRAPTPDSEVLACRAAVEGLPGLRHDVWLLADTDGERRAIDLGLRSADRVTAPLGRAVLAWRSLRRLGSARARPGVVQAWSRPVELAARIACAGLPVLGPPATLPAPTGLRWPARAGMRRSLELADEDTAILLLSEPAPDAQAAGFLFLIGLLDFAGHRVAGILPRGVLKVPRSRAFYRRAVLECPVRYTSLPGAALATACDVGVLLAPPARESSAAGVERRAALVRTVERAGLPVVCPAESGVGGTAAFGCPVSSGTKPADYAKAIVDYLAKRDARGAHAPAPPSSGPAPGDTLTNLESVWRSAARTSPGGLDP